MPVTRPVSRQGCGCPVEPDVLVSRERELAVLQRCLTDARGVVLVKGNASVGKTSLAAALARHARARGVWTAWGAPVSKAKEPRRTVIGDLHWSDVPSMRLFQCAASAVADTRLLLVGMYRAPRA